MSSVPLASEVAAPIQVISPPAEAIPEVVPGDKKKRKRKTQAQTEFDDKTVPELRAELKNFQIQGISRMPKDSLIALLVFNKKSLERKEKKKATKKAKPAEAKEEDAKITVV